MRPSNDLENKTFRHILKSSASMYESSGSQFFRTTTRFQSRPGAFSKSMLVMTFVTNLEVTEICSFRLVLEGNWCKNIRELSRLEFLEKFLGNNFALSDAEGNISGPVIRGVNQIYLCWEHCYQFAKSPESQDSGKWYSCFISTCKLDIFKNPFAKITSLSELYFRFRRFILLVQTKKSDFYELWQQYKQLKTMEMSKADLIFTMRDIYTSIPT